MMQQNLSHNPIFPKQHSPPHATHSWRKLWRFVVVITNSSNMQQTLAWIGLQTSIEPHIFSRIWNHIFATTFPYFICTRQNFYVQSHTAQLYREFPICFVIIRNSVLFRDISCHLLLRDVCPFAHRICQWIIVQSFAFSSNLAGVLTVFWFLSTLFFFFVFCSTTNLYNTIGAHQTQRNKATAAQRKMK